MYNSIDHQIQKLFLYHAREWIETLCTGNLHFSVACDTQMIYFEPELTQELQNKIEKISFFVLSGYSFQSLKLFEQCFSFEAGLIIDHQKDIGTLLVVPYDAVVQIFVQNEEVHQPICIFTNPFQSLQNLHFDQSLNAILSKNTDLMRKE